MTYRPLPLALTRHFEVVEVDERFAYKAMGHRSRITYGARILAIFDAQRPQRVGFQGRLEVDFQAENDMARVQMAMVARHDSREPLHVIAGR